MLLDNAVSNAFYIDSTFVGSCLLVCFLQGPEAALKRKVDKLQAHIPLLIAQLHSLIAVIRHTNSFITYMRHSHFLIAKVAVDMY